jgi:hypothetical protein
MKKEIWYLRLSTLSIGGILGGLSIFIYPKFVNFYPQLEPTIIYFRYPFIIGIYIQSILVFYALFHIWRILNLITSHEVYTKKTIQLLRMITFSFKLISGLFVLIIPMFVYVAEVDDAPGLILIGLLFVGVSLAMVALTSLSRKLLVQTCKRLGVDL